MKLCDSSGLASSIHSWLNVRNRGHEYLSPEYYQALLRPYVFDGKSDIDLFRLYLAGIEPTHRVLEIGPGTGRATRVVLETDSRIEELLLVEQSSRMTDFLARGFPTASTMTFANTDAITYLTETHESFDLVFSLWSISHAIHQSMSELGPDEGRRKSELALYNLFRGVMRSGAHFFLIHFDSTSPEQIIALRQRTKLTPWLVPGMDSPSKLLIDKVLQNLSTERTVSFSAQRLVGEPIVYKDSEEALEIFMNFHMESAFNDTPQRSHVIAELEKDFARYQDSSGRVSIPTGCLIYQGTRH